jgi:hypothetical protein
LLEPNQIYPPLPQALAEDTQAGVVYVIC